MTPTPPNDEIPSATLSPAAETLTSWPELGLVEQRVLGVLVEKAKTTPETYPLSLNALVTGCNQKSNRSPVVNLSESDVEEGLASAQKKGLAIKITGGRVERWRHALYEAWNVDKVELAILAELLLRGPQTEGELRGRASRMEPIADLETLRAKLRTLSSRKLVVYLTPEGRRGTVLTHGFHGPEELEHLRRSEGREAPEPSPAPSRPLSGETKGEGFEMRLQQLTDEIEKLRTAVTDLQTQVTGLGEQIRSLPKQ
jgi:uncharacterized protein YceH (UPF0502 family)